MSKTNAKPTYYCGNCRCMRYKPCTCMKKRPKKDQDAEGEARKGKP